MESPAGADRHPEVSTCYMRMMMKEEDAQMELMENGENEAEWPAR